MYAEYEKNAFGGQKSVLNYFFVLRIFLLTIFPIVVPTYLRRERSCKFMSMLCRLRSDGPKRKNTRRPQRSQRPYVDTNLLRCTTDLEGMIVQLYFETGNKRDFTVNHSCEV